MFGMCILFYFFLVNGSFKNFALVQESGHVYSFISDANFMI